ncbi:hypothetical protein Sango_2726500 [Sesamum angolense]|uniref:Zinc finger PMZ-type domain-containing protein n=1 Tax=Sesamum angolense TaxID=2727404 RepID=A0AAE1T7Q6_9LAMI|nr:hypothetical protein Sango_2726500 [Sesamum angolense]
MRIPRSSTYAQFLSRIYQKIGVDSNEYLLKVSAKHSCQYLSRIKETLLQITNDDTLSLLLDPEAKFPMLEVYVDAEKIHLEAPPQMSQQWGEVNPQMSQQWGEANAQMSNQWGECMTLLATPGLPSCSNTDYLAGTSNLDFGAEPTQSHTPLSENFIPHENDAEDPIGDSFTNESDDASEPDEAAYSIPPEDGPNDVDINVMAETFAQDSVDVPNLSHSQQSASVVIRRQNGHGINTHVVKIANRECSCGKWNQFGIPRSHAQKVCGAYNISVASMVKDYYDLMAYNNTYSKHFEAVQSEDYWDDSNFQLVHDPTIRISTRPDRNQTTRIHNEMDWRQTRARQEAQQQGDSSI